MNASINDALWANTNKEACWPSPLTLQNQGLIHDTKHNKRNYYTDKHAHCIATNTTTNWLGRSHDQTGSLQLWTAFFFSFICFKKKSIAKTFERMYQFFLPLHSFPYHQFGSCTFCHKSKIQLKGRGTRRWHQQGSSSCRVGTWLGENQWEGALPYMETAQWEGEKGVKIFLFFFFYRKMMHLFYPGRAKAKTKRKKNSLLNIFWKKKKKRKS